ncbi:CHAT domain-containing protein [Pseudanabaena sp. CCNP1317]|jgi:CHAT domain-containing protein/predicted negative regulator of RcsB-dependent stress response|uniref:CHAT domain-containing protein n=1 Tax=Pseudanabaena sp. CCNP1317 TaxID=3110253 RepID=UPI002B21C30E|nr:CHAT domain-containing protein [Pseudanabaena sp. CCNP1317]MEA5489271.1 CHAT domain-containing protein [Pseudanabaena sp. CCNP1317]
MFFWQFIVNLKSKSSKLLSYIIVGTCTAILTMLLGWNPQPSIANNPSKDLTDLVPTQSLPNSPSTLFQNGKQLYHAGQYAKAIASWQQALNIYMKQGDRLNRAIVLNNLALASQQLGQWHDADRTIAMSLEILKSEPQQEKLLAQALNIQGSIQLIQGKAQEALTIWQMATASYEQVGDKDGAMRSKINQSQAMRALGLYPKAKSLLQQVQIELREQPDSSLKASSLLNLGDTLQRSGELEDAKVVLQESLAIAKQINNPAIIANTLLSLGNTTYRLQQPAEAIGYYQQAINTATAPILKLQAQLNLLRLQIDTQQSESTQLLLTAIQTQLPNLPPSRDSVYAKVNFVQSLTKLNLPSSNRQAAAQILAIAAQQAKDMGDPRSESYALGYLGELYEQNLQYSEAQQLTEKALILAQTNNASDMSYRWQWQLGRVFKSKGENSKAIAAYSEAVNTLASIRGDLVSSNADIQFSFRDSVEPVYRQLVALLLMHEDGKPVSQENLKSARTVIESLQVAELDNFFKEACLTNLATQVDEVDPQAAVIYPIVLPNSLEVVVSLPDRSLQHYTRKISQPNLENLLRKLRRSLRRTSLETEIQEVSQEVYSLLIGKEMESLLVSNQIKTLAFVLDGSLRNLPMAVLHDGQHYLMEKYNLAIAPGLQLIDPQPIKRQQLKVFIGGLSKETQNFKALPNVEREIQQIANLVSTQVPLLNETFISESIQDQISKNPFRVVHLATHGEFSSNAEKTFILTWNSRLGIKQLGDLLQTRNQDSRNPIELLVLSACKSAKGDNRAALGLAGVAVRSGARSTIASLWSVEDSATATLMENLYQQLATFDITKAESLRNAQISLLKKPQFTHPFYWAPFVLVGNWL